MSISEIKNTDLLRSFNEEGHYYTSYPSLNHWTEDFGPEQYKFALSNLGMTPVHLYVHIPFCAKLCWYCICNIVVTNNREKIETFLQHLLKEADILQRYHPNIREIQLGGGTPSHFDRDQFSRLCDKLNVLVDLKTLDEFAMEIDPRTVNIEDLKHYHSRGVNRISFGVQDFNPAVQKAINREQPYEMVKALLSPEIRSLFSVNFDLLYGLPKQTHETIKDTLEKVKELSPDRITLLKYCHVPDLRKHMKLIKDEQLPPKEDLPVMFVNIIESLLDAGYEWVGLDHFAKKSDSLGRASIEKRVGRTFNGFTPGRVKDMVGLGPTTTQAFGKTYAQSTYDLNEYYNFVNRGEFPIMRGYTLSKDDSIRREVIFSLMCNQRVDFKDICRKYDISISYFDTELKLLGGDLCSLEDGVLQTTAYGRVLLRNLCKLFDRKDVEPKHHKIAQKTITKKVALA